MSTVQQSGPAISPAAFRASLRIEHPASGLEVPLESVIDDWQRADFEAVDGALVRVARGDGCGPQGAWFERARGHSKTSDIAIQVAYLLLASPTGIRGVAAAASKDQAKILRNSIERLKRLNPRLLGDLEVTAYRVKNTLTGSELEVISADDATSYGLQADFIVCDELTHWGDAGESLWGSLFSASAKNSRCLLLVISNAGEIGSWQHGVREAIRLEPSWHFNALAGVVASWLDAARIEQQERLLPGILFERYWLNRWTGSSESAFTPDQIAAALAAGETCLGSAKGWAFFAGLDLGIRQDFSGLCALGKHVGWTQYVEQPAVLTSLQKALIDMGEADEPEPDYLEMGEPGTGQLRLAHLGLWKPSQGLHVDVGQIERAVLELHHRCPLSALWIDPSQAAYLGQRLRKAGVPVFERDQTVPSLHEQALASLDAFREGQVAIPSDVPELEQLLSDLERAEIAARQTKVRLQSPKVAGEGHGDLLTAFSLAATAARFAPSGRMPTIDRPDLIQAI